MSPVTPWPALPSPLPMNPGSHSSCLDHGGQLGISPHPGPPSLPCSDTRAALTPHPAQNAARAPHPLRGPGQALLFQHRSLPNLVLPPPTPCGPWEQLWVHDPSFPLLQLQLLSQEFFIIFHVISGEAPAHFSRGWWASPSGVALIPPDVLSCPSVWLCLDIVGSTLLRSGHGSRYWLVWEVGGR